MKIRSLTSFVTMIDGKDLSFCRNGIYEMNEIDAKFFIAKGLVEKVEEEKPKTKKKKSETDK